MRQLILATRGSALAMAQTQIIKAMLFEKGIETQILKVSTKGDKNQSSPLNAIGGNGLFVREIENELLLNHADVAVHSAKDLPYEFSDGLVVPCVPKAAAENDVLLLRKGETLKPGSIIGTGSARRIAQGEKLFPGCVFKDIRGNVDTRLKKLLEKQYDALILAKAGLERLNTDLSIFEKTELQSQAFIPAACQGIIALQCRKDDKNTIEILQSICDEKTKKRFDAERYMLSLLKADCTKAIGIYAQLDGEKLTLNVLFGNKTAQKSGSYESFRLMCEEIRDEIYE